MMKLHKNTLHSNYLEEIEKLKVIAKLQYDDEIISMDQFNDILFTLFDKMEVYKRNIIKVKIPEVKISNYKNINILQITETLFCTG